MLCKDASARTLPTSRPVKRFLDYLFVECGLSGGTVTAYQRDLNEFWAFLEEEGVCLEDLTLQEVIRHLTALAERGLSLRSIARHVSSLKMFLRFARAERMTGRDLAHLLEAPRVGKSIPRALSIHEMDLLLRALDPACDLYPRDKALVEFLYATGLRVSEVAKLRIEQINFKVGFLRCIGKGQKERVVPVGRFALEALQEYFENLRPHLLLNRPWRELFLSRTGKPLDRGSIWRIVHKYGRKAGIDASVYPHLFRHTFATHMLEGGADLRIVQELLGHAALATTEIYTSVNPVHLRRVHQKCHPRP